MMLETWPSKQRWGRRHALKPTRWLVILLLLFTTNAARANDAAWGGTPAGLVPLQQNQVRMVSEDIVMTARGVHWDVTATYVFRNEDTKELSLNVGFPELHCRPDESNCSNPGFIDLRTWVDGKPVTHEKGKLADHHEWSKELGVIWLFDVTFPSGKEVTIKHTYAVRGGEHSFGAQFINYLVRTGIHWKGSIGRAKFTARFPPYTHTVYKIPIDGLTAHPPKVASDKRVELVLEGSDWTPTEDVRFMFHDQLRGAHHDGAGGCASEMGLEEYPEDIRNCRNLLYANRGYPFKSKKLRDQFYSGERQFRDLPEQHFGLPAWGRLPVMLRGFKYAWFDREDRRVLKLFDRFEKPYLAELQAQAKGPAAKGGATPEAQNPGETLEQLPPLPPEVDSGAAAPATDPSSAASSAPLVSAAPNAGEAPEGNAAPSAAVEPTLAAKPAGKCDCASVGAASQRPLSPMWVGLLMLSLLGAYRRRGTLA